MVEQEKIGMPTVLQCNIGFVAPDDKENRYFNPKLGGGATKDITVYAYEITTFILNQAIKNISVSQLGAIPVSMLQTMLPFALKIHLLIC